jgi:hypothetical protein
LHKTPYKICWAGLDHFGLSPGGDRGEWAAPRKRERGEFLSFSFSDFIPYFKFQIQTCFERCLKAQTFQRYFKAHMDFLNINKTMLPKMEILRDLNEIKTQENLRNENSSTLMQFFAQMQAKCMQCS